MSRRAVVAWGSLVWDPRDLAMAGDWALAGPDLPIEFSRIASDGRLTLIVDARHGAECRTWVCDSPLDLPGAVENLAAREGCSTEWIGWVDRSTGGGGGHGSAPGTDRVREWCAREGYDGAVWTGLPPTFEERTGRPFSVAAALAYLDSLTGSQRERAFEYIRRAPRTTVTPLRTAFEAR